MLKIVLLVAAKLITGPLIFGAWILDASVGYGGAVGLSSGPAVIIPAVLPSNGTIYSDDFQRVNRDRVLALAELGIRPVPGRSKLTTRIRYVVKPTNTMSIGAAWISITDNARHVLTAG